MYRYNSLLLAWINSRFIDKHEMELNRRLWDNEWVDDTRSRNEDLLGIELTTLPLASRSNLAIRRRSMELFHWTIREISAHVISR